MIYYNLNTINDWNFGDDNIIKVYKRGAVCYYKIASGDTPTPVQEPCFAVVDDISQYSDTEFEDVYDKATEKWFKLNNLNAYEEYGIYASGRTSCEGSSRLPQGYTEVEYIENTSTAYINLGVSPYSANGNSFVVDSTFSSFTQSSFAYLISTEYTTSPYYGFILRWVNNNLILDGASIGIDTTATNIPNGDGTSAITFYSDSTTTNNNNTPITLFCGMNGSSPWRNGKGKCYSFKLTINNNIVRDLVPCKRDSDDKYGMYDLVTDTFYLSPNSVDFSGGDPVTPTDCVTTYNGKLTIDDGYEYEWNDSSWVNLGEVSGSSVVEYIETPTSSPYAGIELLTSPSSQSTPMYYEVDCLVKSNQGDNSILGQKSEIETVSYQFGFQAYSSPYYDYGGGRLSTNWSAIGGLNNRIKVGFGVNSGDSKVVIKNLDTSTVVQSTTATPRNVTIPLLCNAKYNTNTSGDTYARSGQVRYYGIKIYDNNVLVGDYIPAKNPSTNEYTFYETISQRYCSKIGTGTIAGHEEGGGSTEYPKYYDEIQDPPDNLVFSSMAEAEAYECPWVGMHATIDGDRYVFSGDSQSGYEWVENQHSLPDVPFVLNYNAKQYNASTKALLKTEGQLADVDAVITAGTPTVHDGYLTIASSTRATISGYQNYFNRSNTTPNLTIISKQRTDGSNCHMFANRDSDYNWMYRCYSDRLTLHGSGEQGSVAVTTQPVIESVRVDLNRFLRYNNYTNNTSSTTASFNYGGTNSGGFALFAGYASSTGEWFVGDFYWVYMCQGTLTDEQVQQVIDYNENL